jgi:hypothetical protein
MRRVSSSTPLARCRCRCSRSSCCCASRLHRAWRNFCALWSGSALRPPCAAWSRRRTLRALFAAHAPRCDGAFGAGDDPALRRRHRSRCHYGMATLASVSSVIASPTLRACPQRRTRRPRRRARACPSARSTCPCVPSSPAHGSAFLNASGTWPASWRALFPAMVHHILPGVQHQLTRMVTSHDCGAFLPL